MQAKVRKAFAMAACLGALSTGGCQTYELGQSLPSPMVLRDDLQYFPKGPSFPHHNEINSQIAAERDQNNR